MLLTDLVARVLADALLTEGPWSVEACVRRLHAVFGGSRSWMVRLARQVHVAFPRPPRDARDGLARYVRQLPSFQHAYRRRGVLARIPAPSPEMGRTPWPVPALPTATDLAAFLGIDPDALVVLADRKGLALRPTRGREAACHYTYQWTPKRSSGYRLLESPRAHLKALQRRILLGILDVIPPHEAAHGFRKGRGVCSFAKVHVGAELVVRLDLEAFFPSVSAGRVYGVFRAAGYPEETARVLTALTTHRTPAAVLAEAPRSQDWWKDRMRTEQRLRTPHLPQGAPTSPSLANLAALGLDARLTSLAESLGGRYTRYADDLVFSLPEARGTFGRTVVAAASRIVREEGYAIAVRKTRVQTRAMRQEVAGVVVNEKLSLRRRDLDELRAILHNSVRFGPDSQNRLGHPDFRGHLLGRIGWVSQVDPQKGERLRAVFERIVWV